MRVKPCFNAVYTYIQFISVSSPKSHKWKEEIQLLVDLRLRVPDAQLEVAVAEEMLDRAVEEITSAAKTDKIGDGKLFILNLPAIPAR